ncbi:MAG: NAD(P)H-dependent oxidoreductase [Flavobacteriaceae bacterium]|nr:NAD(P)H-dependent oxidoreductase [Flavobacteriaceae bacterium]
MKKVLVFAGSTSRNSINKKFATLAATKLKKTPHEIIDLNDYKLPLFSVDIENEEGFPQEAKAFKELIDGSEGIILSLAEHNGSYSAAFKNLMDWLSRIEANFWVNKPMLLLSTSPGQLGAKFVMEAAMKRFPIHGSNIIANFSLPSFDANFSEDKLLNEELNKEFLEMVAMFEDALK